MRKIKAEEKPEAVRKSFAGRSVLVSELSASKETEASALVLDTIKKVLDCRSIRKEYGRMLSFHAMSIANKRDDGLPKAAEIQDKKEVAIVKALQNAGIKDFEIALRERTGNSTTYYIYFSNGKHKSVSIPDGLMSLADPIKEIGKKLALLDNVARADTLPDMPLLGMSPISLKERKVVFEGFVIVDDMQKRRFTYKGIHPEVKFEIRANIEGRNLITAIDLKIQSAHKSSGKPYEPKVLEAQSARFEDNELATKVPPRYRRIAGALDRLVSEKIETHLVPAEYSSAFKVLRALYEKSVTELSAAKFQEAFALLDHPAYEMVRTLPDKYFDKSGELTAEGTAHVMRRLAHYMCSLPDNALHDLVEAYFIIGGDPAARRWDLPNVRRKHFQIVSKIRKFLKEDHPFWSL